MRPITLIASLPALVAALPTTTSGAYEVAKRIVARAPEEAKAVLKSVTSAGAGCAANSAAFVFQDDATIAFDSMVLDSTEAVRTKRCLITIDLQLDPAWKYTINKATTTRGFVENEGGSYKVAYTAGGKTSEIGGTIKPTADGNWATKATSSGATSAYGGGVAGIDVSLSLAPVANKQTTITIDTVDIKFDYSK